VRPVQSLLSQHQLGFEASSSNLDNFQPKMTCSATMLVSKQHDVAPTSDLAEIVV